MSELFPQIGNKINSWQFNGPFGKNFEAAFNLQMWCFGCDINRKPSNLLEEYGFSKSRPSAGLSGSTHYSKSIGEDESLHLWGFAVIINKDSRSLCLRRYNRIPRYRYEANLFVDTWRPHELPQFYLPKTHESIGNAKALLKCLCRELSKYETYVRENTLDTYRVSCLKKKRLYKTFNAGVLELVWKEIYESI